MVSKCQTKGMRDFLNLFSPYFLLVRNIEPSFQPQCSTCCRMASPPSLPRTCPVSAMSIPHPGKHLTPGPTGTAGHPNVPVPNHTYIPDFTSAHASFPARMGHHLVLPEFFTGPAQILVLDRASWIDWLIGLYINVGISQLIDDAEAPIPEISSVKIHVTVLSLEPGSSPRSSTACSPNSPTLNQAFSCTP